MVLFDLWGLVVPYSIQGQKWLSLSLPLEEWFPLSGPPKLFLVINHHVIKDPLLVFFGKLAAMVSLCEDSLRGREFPGLINRW